MGQSILRCPKKGSTTRVRFPGSPPPKPRKNAHMNRSLLKLFFAQNQLSGRGLTLRLTKMSEKGRKFYSFSLKYGKKQPWNQRLVVDPRYGQFWGLANYSRSVFHPPLPCFGGKGRFWKASTGNFFLHLSARSWAIITL